MFIKFSHQKKSLKLPPPKAQIIPKTFINHGDKRIDHYFWLREKENPKVINYLKAENTYTETIMKDTKQLQKALFQELKGRIQQDDSSVPEKIGDYFYYRKFIKGKNYPVYCRKYKSLKGKEELTLDCNKLAAGQKYFDLAYANYSPDHRYLAYAMDLDGSEKYTIYIKDLKTGSGKNSQYLLFFSMEH